jgi:threonylcarbamoyladenosine tRNA methylthiotransferase CDKAL1
MLEIYFETYGCTANKNSTEIMKGLVRQRKLEITSNENYADLIVINSCIVKEPTQEKIRKRIQDLLEKGKKVILAGCMPRLNQKLFQEYQGRQLFLLDTSQIKSLPDLIKDIYDNNYSDKYLRQRKEIKLNLPKSSDSPLIGITQVSEGCLGECNYCIVRLAKGKLFSYPQERIVDSIKKDLESGAKEIWITSQDNASYGLDQQKYLLPNLIKKVLNLRYRFKLRIGMCNPNNILPILEELIEIYKHPKMFKFLHLPIQSGSNKILKEMNRKYTKEDVLRIINKFKKETPNITISTDIIVGYPGETEEDWKQTINLIEEIKPEFLNRSNFAPRPNTSAEKLQQIPEEIMTKRATQLMKYHLKICNENQQKYLGEELKVLIDSKGFENTWLGRADNYKLVAVQSKEKLLGKNINVKITKLSPHYLIGKKVD